jgi:hypothetical protein
VSFTVGVPFRSKPLDFPQIPPDTSRAMLGSSAQVVRQHLKASHEFFRGINTPEKAREFLRQAGLLHKTSKHSPRGRRRTRTLKKAR